jgi:hypothetical protein
VFRKNVDPVDLYEFWPSQWELSQHLKYMARARIPEFESSQPFFMSSEQFCTDSHCQWALGEGQVALSYTLA